MNGYKIVLLKAILCFIGCRKVNGYAPEYVTPEGIYEYSRIVKDWERGLEGSRAGEAVNGIPMGNSEISYGSED